MYIHKDSLCLKNKWSYIRELYMSIKTNISSKHSYWCPWHRCQMVGTSSGQPIEWYHSCSPFSVAFLCLHLNFFLCNHMVDKKNVSLSFAWIFELYYIYSKKQLELLDIFTKTLRSWNRNFIWNSRYFPSKCPNQVLLQ